MNNYSGEYFEMDGFVVDIVAGFESDEEATNRCKEIVAYHYDPVRR